MVSHKGFAHSVNGGQRHSGKVTVTSSWAAPHYHSNVKVIKADGKVEWQAPDGRPLQGKEATW